MSSGSKGIPGVWRAIENWKGVETMMTMSWMSLKSLRSALSTSSEKSEWQRPRRFAFLKEKHLLG